MPQSHLEQYVEENQRLTLDLEQAMRTIHDLQRQLINARYEVKSLKDTLHNATAYAVGERGHACMSIDGGNL